jgi:hypothetical protein
MFHNIIFGQNIIWRAYNSKNVCWLKTSSLKRIVDRFVEGIVLVVPKVLQVP